MNHRQTSGEVRQWEKPEILIGFDYVYKFIQWGKAEVMKCRFSSINSKIGPMIAGVGFIEQLQRRNNNINDIKSINAVTSEFPDLGHLET